MKQPSSTLYIWHDRLTQLPASTLIPNKYKTVYNICTMLDQRRSRWADFVRMLYKCFVFDGLLSTMIRLRLKTNVLELW